MRFSFRFPVVFASALLSFAGPRPDFALAAGEPDPDSIEVVSIAQKLLDAVTLGDSAAWNFYLHPDCIFRTEDGGFKRKNEIVAEIRGLPAGYVGQLRVTNPVVVRSPGHMILSFVADERLELYGQTIATAYAAMDTYVRTPGGWRLLSSELFELPADPPAISVDEQTLRLYEGRYRVSEGVEFVVKYDGKQLIGQRSGRPPVTLVPETESVFFVAGQRGRKIFGRDEEGNVRRMYERRSGRDLVWTKVE